MASPNERTYVAVCGPDPATPAEMAAAGRIGRLLASEGAVLVCGGLGGVMEAACRGSSQEGGTSIGILPGTRRAEANPHLTVSVATGMGEMRNALIVRSADAVIAVGGEYGTLSEVALALKIGVPVVGLGTWELAKEGRQVEAFIRVRTAEDAVREALRVAREPGRSRG